MDQCRHTFAKSLDMIKDYSRKGKINVHVIEAFQKLMLKNIVLVRVNHSYYVYV